MNGFKKVISVLVSIVLWVVILTAALFAFTTMAARNTSEVASIAGYTPMVVQSDSMKPTFSEGDLIVIRKCDPARLVEGDIITFHTIINNEYALNTHRIVKIEAMNGARSYVTRGDSNMVDDRHIISDGDIVGKYVTVLPGVGKVMNFLSSSIGFLLVIILPLMLFFIYKVYQLIMIGINLKKAIRLEEEEEKAKIAAKYAVPTQEPEAVTPIQPEAGAPAKVVRGKPEIIEEKPTTERSKDAEQIQEEAYRMMEEAQAILAEVKALRAREAAKSALEDAKRLKKETEQMINDKKSNEGRDE